MNVWELQLFNLSQQDDEALNLSTVVSDEEALAINNFIQEYCHNKKE